MKAALYAAAAVPEYWVVDIAAGLVDQLWRPRDGAYVEHRQQRLGERVEAASLPLAVDVPGAE